MRLPTKLHLYSFKFFPILDRLWSLFFYPFKLVPITAYPLSSPARYHQIHRKAVNSSYPEVDSLEARTSYSINRSWFYELALATQTVIKTSDLSFAHGRVLYSLLCQYIYTLELKQHCLTPVTIFETGTARGFSSLCMAKALADMSHSGRIHTCDVLPHNVPIYWNSLSDHTFGRITRSQLLHKWHDLTTSCITYHQSTSKIFFLSVHTERIHFAFLDATHTYAAVIAEFRSVQEFQKPGDIIVFDDYDPSLFPGVVNAVKFISITYPYQISYISTGLTRSLAVATRI